MLDVHLFADGGSSKYDKEAINIGFFMSVSLVPSEIGTVSLENVEMGKHH